MAAEETIRQMLGPGRRLDAGRVCEVVELVEGSPRKISQLVECLWDEDAAVANRAADALERLTREKPERAQRWKDPLLGLMAEAAEKKLRWNLALVIPRLKLTVPECRRAASVLHSYLDDPSSIVKTAALHGLADLTRQDTKALPEVLELLQIVGRSGTPAIHPTNKGPFVGTPAIHPTNKGPFVGTPAIHPTNKGPFVGTPAMRARSRILLKNLENPSKKRRPGSSLHMFK